MENTPHTVYISTGSNIGDGLKNCRNGIAALLETGRVTLAAQSPFYRTAPVDYTDQDWFVNGVVKVQTSLSPRELLHKLKGIQKTIGRKAETVRFGPRVLDLDIIFFDDVVCREPDLIIPHPRMHKRRFVLIPLCDIDPTIVHPVLGIDVQGLLARLDQTGQEVYPYICD